MRRVVLVLALAIGGCGTDASSTSSTGGSGGSGGSATTGGAGGVGGAGGTTATGGAGGCVADLKADAENCGACGKSCFGGTCTDGLCGPAVLDAPKNGTPRTIAANDSAVFWGDSIGFVKRMDLPHGTPKQIGAKAGVIDDLVIDANNAYWVSGNTISGYQVPLDGGTAITLFNALNSSSSVAVSAKDVYVGANGSPGAIRRYPIGGGPYGALVAANWVAALVVDGDVAYWISYDYSQQEPSTVSSIALAGGTRKDLATNVGYVVGLAVDATHVYWVDGNGGTVSRVPKGGGTPATIASGLDGPRQVAVRGELAFVTVEGASSGTGTIVQVPISGGSPVVIASDQDHPGDVCATAAGVFWVNAGTSGSGGSVMALAR